MEKIILEFKDKKLNTILDKAALNNQTRNQVRTSLPELFGKTESVRSIEIFEEDESSQKFDDWKTFEKDFR